MTTPYLERAFALAIELGAPIELGEDAQGRHRFIPITGGQILGPRLMGRVLAGGGDRQTIGADGLTRLHAAYFLQTEDGARIGIDNRGVRFAEPPVSQKLAAGEIVPPEAYYFRTTPVFDVRPGRYDWLLRNVFVGQGVREPDRVLLRVFSVL